MRARQKLNKISLSTFARARVLRGDPCQSSQRLKQTGSG